METKLTEAQKARIEKNRMKALQLRASKVVAQPYPKKSSSKAENNLDPTSSVVKVQGVKYVDSGAGFLLEQPVCNDPRAQADDPEKQIKVINTAIPIPVAYEECQECGDHFADSFLFSHFGYSVCDKCREPEEKHSLITRTEAKDEYLLKDCDFDRRDPPLRFISRKNPHNVNWGEMKLYLLLQVEKRAMEVWGNEEELMRQHENREDKREITKIRKYNKKMKNLRMEVRSSLYVKTTKASHEHEFGPDTYNEDDDNYTHSCLTCNFTQTYEKM